eukprot:CAMPEP_0198118402 /NCGR_PEP_ID=MMETSP1442-20131203/21562_1 /TAXON_ID= /ORGANISM="Craspedostauros australis, Strain CCMP3328" /LENGTH=132 /DNA_ID=CAMNT_0043776655 /DNA_START=490 /DNA_END=887 /DNA_ORIENTATION=+
MQGSERLGGSQYPARRRGGTNAGDDTRRSASQHQVLRELESAPTKLLCIITQQPQMKLMPGPMAGWESGAIKKRRTRQVTSSAENRDAIVWGDACIQVPLCTPRNFHFFHIRDASISPVHELINVLQTNTER